MLLLKGLGLMAWEFEVLFFEFREASEGLGV